MFPIHMYLDLVELMYFLLNSSELMYFLVNFSIVRAIKSYLI